MGNYKDDMGNYKGGGTSLRTVLGDYEATGAEATKQISFAAVDFDDDAYIEIVFDLIATAQLGLLLQVNGNTTSNYQTDGRYILNGAETLVDINSGSSATVINSACSLADRDLIGTIKIFLAKGGANDYPKMLVEAGSIVSHTSTALALLVNLTNISSITLLTTTSTWKIGGRITVYKVARA